MAVALECINFIVPTCKRSSGFGAWRLKISDRTSGEGWSLNGFAGFFERLLKAGVIARLRVALNEAWSRRCS